MAALEIILGIWAVVLLITWVVSLWLLGVKDVKKAEGVLVSTTVMMICLGIAKAVELIVEGLLVVIK